LIDGPIREPQVEAALRVQDGADSVDQRGTQVWPLMGGQPDAAERARLAEAMPRR
jgi:hypothetical protein